MKQVFPALIDAAEMLFYAAVALALLAALDLLRAWVDTQLPDFEEEEYS